MLWAYILIIISYMLIIYRALWWLKIPRRYISKWTLYINYADKIY